MKTCSECKKQFDDKLALEEFKMVTLKNYNSLKITLCTDCAIKAIEDRIEGIYDETCMKCGCHFDPFKAEVEFHNIHINDSHAYYLMFDDVLCLDCAIEEYKNR